MRRFVVLLSAWLFLGYPATRVTRAWECPSPEDGAMTVGISIPNGYTDLKSDFANNVFTTYNVTSIEECVAEAKAKSCAALTAAFLMYSNDTLTNDPATFDPVNCLVGSGCVNSSAPGTTIVQVASLPGCRRKHCKGSTKYKGRLRCAPPAYKAYVRKCLPSPWICKCPGKYVKRRINGKIDYCAPRG